jgi:hypothetical protein
MRRSFNKLNEALFSIGVKLQIICDRDEMDAVEEIMNDHFRKAIEDMRDELARLNKLLADNGVSAALDYSNALAYKIPIKSPQASMFIGLVLQLDQIVTAIDALWLNAVINSRQRSDGTYQWQQRLVRLAGKIIGTEKRARLAAYKKMGDATAAAAAAAELKAHEAAEKNADINDDSDDAVATTDAAPDAAA